MTETNKDQTAQLEEEYRALQNMIRVFLAANSLIHQVRDAKSNFRNHARLIRPILKHVGDMGLAGWSVVDLSALEADRRKEETSQTKAKQDMIFILTTITEQLKAKRDALGAKIDDIHMANDGSVDDPTVDDWNTP